MTIRNLLIFHILTSRFHHNLPKGIHAYPLGGNLPPLEQEWVLHETHIVGHMKLEITEAEVKQEKDGAVDHGRLAGAQERGRRLSYSKIHGRYICHEMSNNMIYPWDLGDCSSIYSWKQIDMEYKLVSWDD